MMKHYLCILSIFMSISSISLGDQVSDSNQKGTFLDISGQGGDKSQKVSLQSVSSSVYQNYLQNTTSITALFSSYFGTDSDYYKALLGWMASLNVWPLKPVDQIVSPVNVDMTMQVQAAQAANFNSGLSADTLVSLNDLVQKVMVGILYPVVSAGDVGSSSDNIMLYTKLGSLNEKKCTSDWEKRFTSSDYDILCNDSRYTGTINNIFTVLDKYKNDIDFLRRLMFYRTEVQNCSDSIASLANSTSSSSGDTSIGGQSIPDPSTSQKGIPLVQCYFSDTYKLAKNISDDLTSACSGLNDASVKKTCQNLSDSFKDLKSDEDQQLKGITYKATEDNGVSAKYGPVVAEMLSDLQSGYSDVQQAVYAEIFADDLITNVPAMESIYPSMDNLILPSQFGSQNCDPSKADQDQSFEYFTFSDNLSVDYAYNYIMGLDIATAQGLSSSETVDLSDLSDTTTNTPPIYIHGGRYIYCNKSSDSSGVYSSLCEDEKDNVYTTDLATTRSSLYASIATSRSSLSTLSNAYLAQRSAAFSNLWDMYNRRALIGNVSKCTPVQLATYHATWRYKRHGDNPSWQENVRSNQNLKQMDLMREAVLLLQDINYQLYQLNQTSERSMSIDTVKTLSQLSVLSAQLGKTSSTIAPSIKTYDTGYVDTTGSVPTA